MFAAGEGSLRLYRMPLTNLGGIRLRIQVNFILQHESRTACEFFN